MALGGQLTVNCHPAMAKGLPYGTNAFVPFSMFASRDALPIRYAFLLPVDQRVNGFNWTHCRFDGGVDGYQTQDRKIACPSKLGSSS